MSLTYLSNGFAFHDPLKGLQYLEARRVMEDVSATCMDVISRNYNVWEFTQIHFVELGSSIVCVLACCALRLDGKSSYVLTSSRRLCFRILYRLQCCHEHATSLVMIQILEPLIYPPFIDTRLFLQASWPDEDNSQCAADTNMLSWLRSHFGPILQLLKNYTRVSSHQWRLLWFFMSVWQWRVYLIT